jgi:nucleoside-diphosphate-sugar epimerase
MITGASGLVGGHVVRYFAQFEPHLFCLVRATSDASFISDLQVTIVNGDITDLQELTVLFSGMDLVIHTAGKVGDWGNYPDFYLANVTGTLNVLEAAAMNHIPQVIITGSISSYGEEDSRILKDESSGFRSHYSYAFDRLLPSGMNHYRDTKAEATRLAMEYASRAGINLTILEPAWVYGEHESGSGFYTYLKTAASKVPLMPGSRKNTFHVIYAGELARAYWLAANNRTDGVRRFIIGNTEPVNMQRVLGLFCREAGIKKPLNIPKWIIYPAALVIETIALLQKRVHPPLLTRSRVNMFYDSIGYSTVNAWKSLGFRNEVDIETGIRATVSWYKKNNWI